jgi:hypothetical protein
MRSNIIHALKILQAAELGSATGEMQSSVVRVVSVSVLPGTRLRRSHTPRRWMIDGILTVSIDMSTTKSRQIIFFFWGLRFSLPLGR